jgi:hypothetical protein
MYVRSHSAAKVGKNIEKPPLALLKSMGKGHISSEWNFFCAFCRRLSALFINFVDNKQIPINQ